MKVLLINGSPHAKGCKLQWSAQRSISECDLRQRPSARRAGTTAALDRLNKYFQLAEMPVASSRYWNMVHGNSPEEMMQDEEGVQIMRVLGRNVAFLVRAIAAERERGGLPEVDAVRVNTNFIR